VSGLRPELVDRLARGGFVAAEEEADELLAAGGGDPARTAALLERRLTGEPLAWITGVADLCGVRVRVAPGVYVPRWHTEAVAERAAQRLPEDGTAIDVCTGCGAIAAVLQARRPRARVLAFDLDPSAVACARANGVDAHPGDLLDSAGPDLDGAVDLVTGVVPYVPTPELGLLQRDTFTFETELAYDGGTDGLDLARRVVGGAARLLRPGGALVLELGHGQAAALHPVLTANGFQDITTVRDEDGDERGVEASRA
jgi:release factor glutamine methyltransferase